MVLKKKVEGRIEPKTLWAQEVTPVSIKQFAKDTENVEKIIWYGESNSGKTHGYLDVLRYQKKMGVPAKDVCMCIVYSDRATGITKLYNLIPKEYVERVFLFTVSDYEDLVKATGASERILMEHYAKTGVHGWLICELLEEAWRLSQDYYSQQAFGETLADLMAAKRRAIEDLKGVKSEDEKESAYQALQGWRDWTIIKFYHNFNWIDRIKKMPFNVGATAEIRDIANPDSIFSSVKVRPAGEKDNAHRFDTILYKKHVGDKFFQQCFKWTGMSRVYNAVDITDKNGYEIHKQIEKDFIKKGYKSSAIEELEKEAGIPPPPKTGVEKGRPDLKPPAAPPKEEIKESKTPEPSKEKPITSTTKTPVGEKTETMTDKELVTPPKKKEEAASDDVDWSV